MSSQNPTNSELNVEIKLIAQELHQHANTSNIAIEDIKKALEKNTDAIQALLQEFRDMKNQADNNTGAIKDMKEDYSFFKGKVWPLVNGVNNLLWGIGLFGLTGIGGLIVWITQQKK
jgi:hypothetical protein